MIDMRVVYITYTLIIFGFGLLAGFAMAYRLFKSELDHIKL